MSVTLQYPYTAPTLTLTLRNPELGDSEGHNVHTQFQITMDASIYSHKRTPATKRLLLTFRDLVKQTAEDLQTFIETAIGNEVKYTDHTSTIWRGYIVSNPLEMTTERKIFNGTCIETYTATLEFRGSKV